MATLQNTTNVHNDNHIIERAKMLLNLKLQWLSPPSSLRSSGGRDFGRAIEYSLTEISKGEVKRLQLRKRDTAVVMSVDHYAEILQMKEMYSKLIERIQQQEITQATDEFEQLYQRITSPESRRAADDLFTATTDSLNANFEPGTTERK